jgi:hypothetical protein
MRAFLTGLKLYAIIWALSCLTGLAIWFVRLIRESGGLKLSNFRRRPDMDTSVCDPGTCQAKAVLRIGWPVHLERIPDRWAAWIEKELPDGSVLVRKCFGHSPRFACSTLSALEKRFGSHR